MSSDRDLDRDLAALSAGLLPGIALAAAPLGHGLQLIVGIERGTTGRTVWRVLIDGPPGLASDVRLTDTDMHTLRTVLDRAIAANAARAWRIGRNPVVLIDIGECAVGLGVAGGVPWGIITIRNGLLRFPANDLARVRDALAVAAERIGQASVLSQPAGGPVQ